MSIPDCLFCAIAAGTAEASFVGSNDRAVAFMDLRPVGEGHILVIPRRHAVGLADLDPVDGVDVFLLAQRVAAALFSVGLADGVNLFLADGEVAGQEVFHAHLHVLPRRPDDAFTLHINYGIAPSRSQLDAVAARVRTAMA